MNAPPRGFVGSPPSVRHRTSRSRNTCQIHRQRVRLDVRTCGFDLSQRGKGQNLVSSLTMRALIALIILGASGCAGDLPGTSGAAPQSVATGTPDQVEVGRRIVEFQCASCHGVRAEDKSHNPGAPALRTLAERYPVTGLEEAFANGIMIGHPGMPEFRFAPDQIKAILAYLESIQTRQAASLDAQGSWFPL